MVERNVGGRAMPQIELELVQGCVCEEKPALDKGPAETVVNM